MNTNTHRPLGNTFRVAATAAALATSLTVLAGTASFAQEYDDASSVRESGLTVTAQELDGVTVHSLVAPEAAFSNATHLIETDGALVLIDTQFLLPNALDVRAYAEELGKPIDRVFITHSHPDHFLGGEAFADIPMFALQETADTIAEVGDAEVEEKQGQFGDAIAGTYVVPEVIDEGSLEIDGVTFELERVNDAEAETQLVIRLPDEGVVATGDIVYSGLHLILAGQPDTWTAALEDLAASGDAYPIVLPGHGAPADPDVYGVNIAWLATAAELLGTVEDADAFRQGLIDAFPELGGTGAIDFVTPFLFPEA
jgi:glyoxylase-like metal-dependent hydrolase (beta-lactamase superfamily II)